MTLSVSLLVVAALTALLPVASLFLRPPASVRDLEKTLVVAIVTLGIGTFVINRYFGLGLFTLTHLLYLLAVVTVPLLLGSWWLTALVRGSRTRLLRLGGLAAAAIALAGVWGTHIEPNWLRTDVVSLAAPVAQPLKIGVLADLQTPNVGRHEWNAVNALLEQEPDMVLVPGDLYQGSQIEILAATADFVEVLQLLVREVEIVAVVSGDSDWVVPLEPIVVAAGAQFIDNRVIEIDVAGQPVRLAGVPVTSGPARLTTIADLSVPTDALTVLLSHRPDVVFDLPLSSDVDLIVAGHTHGGQISLPFFGPPVTFTDVPRSLAAGGLEIVDRFPVYVSAGVGLERLDAPQVRFGVRPEVGIINVVPG